MNDNRRKLTGILKLLYENTDAEHSMDTYQIMDALESMGHGRPDRKTIDANIKFIINDLGFGIKKEKGKPNRYRWVDREFDLSELKMLVDAVHSSKFITQRKSREIIAKLKDLTSSYQAATLNREMYTSNSFKHDGSEALRNADIINDAIKAKHRVTFQIADYDMDKQEVLKENGKTYEVSPYALLWNNDYYYMIGLQSDLGEIRSYRIDNMKNVAAEYKDAVPAPAEFSLDRYFNRVFDMFSGIPTEVELTCRDNTMKYMIDRFGRNFYSTRNSDDTFSAKVSAEAGPAFYAWVFQFGGDIRIDGPAWVRDQFTDMLRRQE
ncbi:MAG: WYL domain-containing protein [Clostridiales bacterium]|nr:WYL domain-containing protein [Clostridiales bacterium]